MKTPSPSQKRFKVFYGDGNGHLEKEKIVKAWAIVQKKTGIIENADYFVMNECPASQMTEAGAVYLALKDAKSVIIPDEHKIVPCTITYTLPKRKV